VISWITTHQTIQLRVIHVVDVIYAIHVICMIYAMHIMRIMEKKL